MADPVEIAGNGPLGAIGAALQARLKLLFPPAKFTHKWVPPKLNERGWKMLTERTPLIGLSFDQFERQETGRMATGRSEWSVLCVTRNERSTEARFLGDEFAPGILALLQVATAGLHGMTIAGQGSVQFERVHAAVTEEFDDSDLAMARAIFSIGHAITLKELVGGEATDPNTILTRALTWHFDDGTVADTTITSAGTA